MPRSYQRLIWGLLATWVAIFPSPIRGQEPKLPTLPETTIEAPPPEPQPIPDTPLPTVNNQIGSAISPSSGRIDQGQIELLPWLRPGEILELIPGLIVTQHSGSGKANQFFLRGFNLDHGTDFSIYLDGIPMNLRTHGHGQGYLDVNSLIPEIIQSIDFKKGVYYAEVGDFSSAGTASIRTYDVLPQNIGRLEYGMNDWFRILMAESAPLGQGVLLYALESVYYDGPWANPEDYKKYNGLLKYTMGDDLSGLSLQMFGYSAKWNATDQIPLRAVNNGWIDRLGAIDPTDGGQTSRWGGNAMMWHQWDSGSVTRANAYMYEYSLNLYNNFTYFLDDPINGDQFEQLDRRTTSGINLSHAIPGTLCGNKMSNTFGTEFRNDNIPLVGLQRTVRRAPLDIIRTDDVVETSLGLYWFNEYQWAEKVRTVIGLRNDWYRFDVASKQIPENSGTDYDAITSPKGSLILGPFARTNVYLAGGFGFHSNDARGTTIRVDPVTGDAVDPIPGLVRSRGCETGFVSNYFPNLTTSMAVWYLKLDSELVFVGDAGTTEASRASRRYGFEWTNTYKLYEWLYLDADYAATNARFQGDDPAGDYIPGAPGQVASVGPTVRASNGLFASGRLRYFGSRPLIEDNLVRSAPTTVVDLNVGYETQCFRCGFQLLNLLDTDDHDIDYYYPSRLRGEHAAGVNDIHFHPVEPFQLRAYVSYAY